MCTRLFGNNLDEPRICLVFREGQKNLAVNSFGQPAIVPSCLRMCHHFDNGWLHSTRSRGFAQGERDSGTTRLICSLFQALGSLRYTTWSKLQWFVLDPFLPVFQSKTNPAQQLKFGRTTPQTTMRSVPWFWHAAGGSQVGSTKTLHRTSSIEEADSDRPSSEKATIATNPLLLSKLRAPSVPKCGK